MPVQVSRRLPEVGRIRIGRKGDRGQPVRLATFRLTSRDQKVLQQAAEVYGGNVQPWAGQEGQFELITKRNELPILISPERPASWYELWSAGGCQRRCDGETCTVPDGKGGLMDKRCECEPERRTCKLVTRVSFLLPDLPSLGIWRFDTGSVYTAMEMPGMIDVLAAAKAVNKFPEAVLAIEVRMVIRQNEKGKPETRKFPVVTIRIRETLRETLGSGAARAALADTLPALPPGEVREPAEEPEPVPEGIIIEQAPDGRLMDVPADAPTPPLSFAEH